VAGSGGPIGLLATHRQSPEDDLVALLRGLAMDIGERRQADLLVLAPVGRVDNLTSPDFQARLLAAVSSGTADVVVDFSGVEYISSAGLRALMIASRIKPKDRRLAVVRLNAVVHEIFTISRFSHLVPIFSTIEEVSAAWDAPAQPSAAAPSVDVDPEPSPPLRVHFWGTRGSLPAPLRERAVRSKIRDALLAARGHLLDTPEAIDGFIDHALPFSVRGTFGGNTSCIELSTGGDEYLLCDLGTGIREFGNRIIRDHGAGRKHCFNIFLSHPHWDHIMGFPFFTPAYLPGNHIRIHGCHTSLRDVFQTQQSAPFFPVDFRSLGATVEFITLEPGRSYEVVGFAVSALKQFHSGDSYGYRFSRGGKSVVYSTDCEHKYSRLDESYPFISFYQDADLLIFDAMYSLGDTMSVKEDWGHSSNVIAVELAQAARVKRLVLFHHEPVLNDRAIEAVLADTVRFEWMSRRGDKVEVISAYDGLDLIV
jgi:anti-anti-sigma factor